MAVFTRSMQRQRDYSRLFIALAVLAGVVAIAPIAAAVLGFGSSAVSTRTAFASAPAGEYAVIGRSEGTSDVISVAWAQSPGAITEIARLPHLEGFSSTGAVSPDGKKLALVSVDGGTQTHPVASVNVIDLESGRVTQAAENAMPAQTPVWRADSNELVVTRMPGGNETRGAIQVLQAGADGKSETVLETFDGVLGVYPVAFDPAGKLVLVVVGSSGSVMHRDGTVIALSPYITRDWKLSPDGSELAFIEADTTGGVRYLARSVQLDGGETSAQSLSAPVSALGVAFNPKGTAVFGVEPGQGAGAGGGAAAQALSSAAIPEGFDVPMGYSQSGDALVVTHWSGASFQQPGQPAMQLVTQEGRAHYEDFTRFYGWSAR